MLCSITKKLIFICVCLVLTAVFFKPTVVLAETKHFNSSLNTTYTVNEDGSTYVEHNFEIKNLTPTFFVNKYGLQLSSANIANVRVTNGNQAIDAEVVNTDNKTTIGISFPDKVVGEGQTRRFTISYRNDDLSQISGQVLEVSIPKLNDPQSYDKYGIKLITPIKFGAPNRVSPGSFSQIINGRNVELTFQNLKGQGISAIYGEKQIFDLKLRYFLDNDRNQPVISQITLPPDTSLQKMNYESIEPMPKKLEVDADGNWIATYQLDNYSQTEIKIHAQAMLTLENNPDVPVFLPSKVHIQEEEFWPTSDAQIKDIASQNPTAQEIYNYSSTQLNYTTEKLSLDLKRLGAAEAIANPDKATCQEFTDVFVTLARANSIPARRATGFAYSENEKLRPLSLPGDVLHAWPEYFDQEKQSWLAVDPTWGNTTGGVDYFNQFDLNHIVFAYNGESSDRPYPAGSYLESETPQKNVEVSFAKDFPIIEPRIMATVKPQKISFFSIPGFYLLELSNTTGQAWYNLSVDYLSNDSFVRVAADDNSVINLLPYQTAQIPFRVYNQSLSSAFNKKIQILVSIGNRDNLVHDFEVGSIPDINKLGNYQTILTILVAGSVIFTLIAGSIFVLRRRGKNSLRGQSQKIKK